MSVPIAYLGIILIWSTTPLAIQWSTHGTSFALAVFARMLIGVIVAAALVIVWRIRFPLHDRARRARSCSGKRMRQAMTIKAATTAPISMRAKTARAKLVPWVLHWMASGVVDQIRMMPR